MEHHPKVYDRTSFPEIASKFALFPITLSKPFTHPPNGKLAQEIKRLKERGFAGTVQSDEARELPQLETVWRQVEIREGLEILNVQFGDHRQYSLKQAQFAVNFNVTAAGHVGLVRASAGETPFPVAFQVNLWSIRRRQFYDCTDQ